MDNIKQPAINIELAYLDDLTGIYNRRYLYKYLSEELSKLKKLSLFMMDLDGFKKINDSFGHLEGDALLVSFSKAIKLSVKEKGVVVRYAGDEFTVLLPGSDKAEAVNIAERLIQDISSKPLLGKDAQKSHIITTSLGLAVYPEEAIIPTDLIDKADQALYSAKKMGKNRFSTVEQISLEQVIFTKSIKDLSCPKFIDRANELDLLKQFLSHPKENKRAFFVLGPKGIGKTRLVDEFLEFVKSTPTLILRVGLNEEKKNRPYSVFVDAFTLFLDSMKMAEKVNVLKNLREEELAEVLTVMPTLKEIVSVSAASLKQESSKRRINLFKALAKITESISNDNLVLFVVDDIQFIDLASASLIYYLLKAKKLPFFLYATATKEADPNSPYAQTFQRPDSKDFSETVELGTLASEAVNELISSILNGTEIPLSFSKNIFEKIGGNPLFVQETIKLFIDKGKIYFKDGHWNIEKAFVEELPRNIEDAQKSRFDNFEEDAKEILSNAALMGDEFDIDILKKVTQKNEGEILDVIDNAKKLGIVNAAAEGAHGKFNFSNQQMKEVLNNLVDSVKAKDMHKKIAATLESYYKNDLDNIAATILSHYKQAESQNKIIEYTRRMQETQKQLFSPEEAASYIEKISESEEAASLEEILEQPLTEQSKGLLPDAIISLRSAIESAFLYPANNQARLTFQEEAYIQINNILFSEKSLTFSVIESELLINGEELERKELRNTLGKAFAEFLLGYRINSMTFKQGLHREEFAFFLAAVTKNEEDLVKFGGINKYLTDNKVMSVKLDIVKYEKAHKVVAKFKAAKDVLKNVILQYPLLQEIITGTSSLKGKSHDELVGAFKSLQSAIKDISGSEGSDEEKADLILESMEKVASPVLKDTPAEWQNLKGNLNSTFASLDPTLQAVLIKKDLTNISAPGAIINEIVTNSSDEQIVGIVKENLSSKKLSEEDISDMLKVVFTNSFRKNKLMPVLEQELSKLGVSKEEIAKIIDKESYVKEQHVSKMVESSIEEVRQKHLDKDSASDLKSIIEGLFSKGKEDAIISMCSQIINNAKTTDKDACREDLISLGEILGIIVSKDKYWIVSVVMQDITKAFIEEKDEGKLNLFAEVFVKTVKETILNSKYSIAVEIIKKLKTLWVNRTPDQEKILQEQMENQTDSRLLDLISSSFSHDMNVSDENIMGVIIEFSGFSVDLLTKVLVKEELSKDPFEMFVRRRRIALALKRIGPDALERLKFKLNDQNPLVVKNILEALSYMNDKSIVPSLEPIADNQDYLVREELVKTLRKLWNQEGEKILLRLLKDKNFRVRKRTFAVLAEMSGKEIIPELEKFLSDPQIGIEIKGVLDEIKKR